MVYAPQRRHAVASLGTTIQAIGLLQHLYTPNILILISRVLAQVQINAAAFMHPNRSLLALFVMLTVMNLVAVLLHVLDFASGYNGTKGIILDFIGQSHPASMFRVLLLDGLLFVLQLTSLIVSYINNHASNLPSTPSLPYDDLLLPPDSEPTIIDDEEPDLESGEARRRRKGKGAMYDELPNEDNELWLDDDAGKGTSSSSHLLSTRSNPHRRREPPLIFSLPLPHILSLVFRLPAPPPPPHSFSGATPAASPPATPPRNRTPPLTARSSLDDPTEEESDSDVNDSHTSPSGRRNRARGASGLMPEVGRIPGDYWVGRERGDG